MFLVGQGKNFNQCQLSRLRKHTTIEMRPSEIITQISRDERGSGTGDQGLEIRDQGSGTPIKYVL